MGERAFLRILGDCALAACIRSSGGWSLPVTTTGRPRCNYHPQGDSLVFASSLKACSPCPQVARRLNELQLARALALDVATGRRPRTTGCDGSRLLGL